MLCFLGACLPSLWISSSEDDDEEDEEEEEEAWEDELHQFCYL
jgi:hypothetical protein